MCPIEVPVMGAECLESILMCVHDSFGPNDIKKCTIEACWNSGARVEHHAFQLIHGQANEKAEEETDV
jgi:hypothetical protein